MTTETVYRLPIKKAAAAFGIGYTRIYEAVTTGDLPAIRFGTRWLVKPEDVETWIVTVGTSNEVA